MKERSILFSAPMVRAILAGQKTQTRRIIKRVPAADPAAAIYPDGSGKGWIAWWGQGPFSAEMTRRYYPGDEGFRCPYGDPGDRLLAWGSNGMRGAESRITLAIDAVRVERLQDITEDDARAEGCAGRDDCAPGCRCNDAAHVLARFRRLWSEINGVESWESNPWVWVVTFSRVRP